MKRNVLRLGLVSLALLLIGGAGLVAPARASDSTTARPFITANGTPLAAGEPLPILRFTSPNVTSDSAKTLAGHFSSVSTKKVYTDFRNGMPFYTLPSTDTLTHFEEYGATGGFYLFNASDAFSVTARTGAAFDPIAAQLVTCGFLLDKSLEPSNASVPLPCLWDTKPSLVYKTSEAWSASLKVQDGTYSKQQTGLIVQVPMSIDTSPYSSTIGYVPLGGPGGHMSFFFRDIGSSGSGVDTIVPGLAAVAMPFYGRQYTFLKTVPALDPAQVTQQVANNLKASYPGATVSMTTPSLLYWVDDASTPQIALEPKLDFEGVQVTDGGQTLILRDIVVSAVPSGSGATGFGPSVTITSPPNGSRFAPGANVNFQAALSGGTSPYSYTWSLQDGTVLRTGTVSGTSTPLSLTTNQLPVISHGGIPASTQVVLSIVDGDGAERSASVSLRPAVAPSLFLPFLSRSASGATSPSQPSRAPAPAPTTLTSNYTFGIEQGSDYPPYGPGGLDLPGVIPDAGGFKSNMLSYGWSSLFYWANASAWERDWRDCTLGGGDCTYGVDRADFVYYPGHGGDGAIYLPSNVDSPWFKAENARFGYVRWVGFASCRTLRVQGFTAPNQPIRRWFNAFQGANMLLGFNSAMGDVAFGGPLVDNMRMPTFFGIPLRGAQRTIREAWALTAFNLNAGKVAILWAKGVNGYDAANDILPLPTDPPTPRPWPVSWYFWEWWDE
ncbi:MAG: DUF6345 domain-containing protein [Chloroflexi bacterium]|nr:DUF6345 domain-containing protein [Chloroflexota bacterium]